jgi:biopolymer transport protein ExbD
MILFRKKIQTDFQLNLTPIMDLFVGLIPFLILSASFVEMSGIEVQSPSASSTAAQKTESKEELWLSFEVSDSKVTVTGYGKDFDRAVSAVKSEFKLEQLDQLKIYLDGLAQKNYRMGPSLFYVSPETKYEKAISVLSAMRSTKTVHDIVMAAGTVQ